MKQERSLKKIIEILEDCKIDYMLTGAIAVSYYGKPRLTHNIDVLVALQKKDVDNIVKKLKLQFYVDKGSVIDAIEETSMFNAIHNTTGIKIDFWIIKSDKYDELRFSRRLRKKILNKKMYIIAPEDLIITKLLWYKKYKDKKHYDDVEGICQIQTSKLNMEYLDKWTKFFGVNKIFRKVIRGELWQKNLSREL
ncbi:MAG: hypothetical protein AB1779_06670 [Candidatus Thermoplasmatota archaeon]